MILLRLLRIRKSCGYNYAIFSRSQPVQRFLIVHILPQRFLTVPHTFSYCTHYPITLRRNKNNVLPLKQTYDNYSHFQSRTFVKRQPKLHFLLQYVYTERSSLFLLIATANGSRGIRSKVACGNSDASETK